MALKQSSALSILQAAATQALLEDKEEGLGGLLIAADQIANERGLTSPLRRTPLDRSFELSQSFDRHSLERGVLNPNALESSVRSNRSGSLTAAHTATSVHGKENDDDVNALLKQMNVQPVLKPSSDVSAFEADVQALLDLGGHGHGGAADEAKEKKAKGKKIRPNTSSPQRWKSGSGLGRQRYLTRQSLYGRRPMGDEDGFGRSYYSVGGGGVTSEPSRASVMLMTSDDKSYGERVRASFKSEMHEMLFRSMHLVRPTSASASSSVYSSDVSRRREKERQRMMSERLSKPAQHAPSKLDTKFDPTLKHSTYDDAKETTFRPTILGRGGKRAEAKQRDDDDDGPVRREDPKYSFISRQEAEERNRREELAYKIGKQDYDALLTKRVCPKCGAKQSYDEVKEKRKLCPNCRVDYVIPLTWAQVSKHFFHKCLDYSQRVQQHKEAVRKEVEDEYRYVSRRLRDPSTGKHYLVREERQHPTMTREQEEDFLQRVEEHVSRHKEALRQLEAQIVAEYCPFKPQIAKYLRRRQRRGDDDLDDEDLDMLDDDDDDDDVDNSNPIQAFLRRYERDMEARREKMPGRYLPTRRYKPRRKGGEADDVSSDDDQQQDDRQDDGYKRDRSFRF